MKNIVNLLFEAKMLKNIQRSGYAFLGAGKESIAEHSFLITFIGFVMAKMKPEMDALKLISMCLIHDLPESRISDLNYVQKNYVSVNEKKAIQDATCNIPFGNSIIELMDEFNEGKTEESRLARDADQLALILDLKRLKDVGYKTPAKWLPGVKKRLQTELGKNIAKEISKTDWDEWWLKNYVD